MTSEANVSSVLGGTVLNAGPLGTDTMYGKLPPLNPDDLKLPPPPPSAANKVTDTENAISISEVWEELKAKTREIIMGSSVSGVLSAMRFANLTMAGCMIALAIGQIIQTKSAFSAISDVFSVIYTIFFALLLVGYEFRTATIDKILRGSFGFMYSPWGRCLFLSMISIFPFGMCHIYGVLVSLAGFANAYFNYFVITKHPSFTRGVPDYTPPEKTSVANPTTFAEEDKELCERVCKKQACAIQFCLQRHDYQESKCAAVIKQYYNCCAAAMEAEEKTRKPTGTIVTAGNDNGKAKRGMN
ncbi:hypothetical protein DD238_005360 [Peronospora effusa]|uniref:Uncharacterized protein n=1 Tax=Peronospora effusa TaxID=542832 RepID=A0A3M6VC78_9STRA|nr:hypothetical protein DD238_005360 [Peronospora effusa]